MRAEQWCAGLALLLLAGCGADTEPAPERERRTQQEVTAQLRTRIESTARAIVPSARLVKGGFVGPTTVPCQDEGPVRTVHVTDSFLIANTAPDSSGSYLAPARSFLASEGYQFVTKDAYSVTMERDRYVIQVASSPSGRPSITGDTPCVRPADPKHPLGL